MTLITIEQEVAIKALYQSSKNILQNEENPGLLAAMKFNIDWCEKYFNDIIHENEHSNS